MKQLFFSLVFFSIQLSPFAQSVVNTTGATIKNNSYVFEYSIGEIAISTLQGSTGDVTQGLLQPSLKIANPDCDVMSKTVNYFENPTKDKIRLVGIYDWIKSYQIFSSDGRLVRSQNFYNNYVDVTGLPAAGIYFIRLMPGCNGKYQIIKFMKR